MEEIGATFVVTATSLSASVDGIGVSFVRGDVVSEAQLGGTDARARYFELGCIREATEHEAGKVHVDLPDDGPMARQQSTDGRVAALEETVAQLREDNARLRSENEAFAARLASGVKKKADK